MERSLRAVDWSKLREEVFEVFTPGPPINELAMFAGRRTVIQRLQDITIERGRHAIIYGERGVGKTSLAGIYHRDLNRLDPASGINTRQVVDVHVNSDTKDLFDSLWRKVFRRIVRANSTLTADLDYTGPIEPDHVFLELQRFTPNQLPVIIIDEYDRIESDECRILMTDVIKSLTLSKNNPTVVLVGVADDITQLVHDHRSISARNLAEVPMSRMSKDEIREIITTRLRRIGMRITDDALWRITYFSAGLPFYAHSLGKYAALSAIGSKRLQIDEDAVVNAIDVCMADVDYSIREAYTKATQRIYRKDNQFRYVLAACALAETNDLGQFTAVAIEAPLSAIVGEPRNVPGFAFHLNEMCGPERGSVLRKIGERRTYQYHFAEAAMQPFVILKSLKDGVISEEIFDRFYVKRQTALAI